MRAVKRSTKKTPAKRVAKKKEPAKKIPAKKTPAKKARAKKVVRLYCVSVRNAKNETLYFLRGSGMKVGADFRRAWSTEKRGDALLVAELVGAVAKPKLRDVRVVPFESERVNPSPRGADVAEVAGIFEGFTGHKAVSGVVVPVGELDKVARIGICLGIAYEAKRDGKRERYYHEFDKKSAPFVGISSGRDVAVLAGGNFEFTDRGFEDRG